MLMRRLIQMTVALVAAVVAYAAVTMPAKHLDLQAPMPANVALGAYHIHTTRSDGAGEPEDVAAAAAKAGLKFAILTDHGDATRTPDAPRYVDGVLLIDGVEVSTADGHVVALGLTAPAPYPLGGDGRDVIEDIHRLGGFAIVAHPDSPRADLRWRPQPTGGGRGGGAVGGDLAGADGVEWMNADSEWRDELSGNWSALANTLLHINLRSAEAFAALLERPATTMHRWDASTRRRDVIGLSAVDAHGLVAGLYAMTFRTFSQAVITDAPLSGDAATDAALVLRALRTGSAYSVITGIASPAFADLRATDGTRSVPMGARLTNPTAAVRVRASIAGAGNARLTIMHNDREVASGVGQVEVAATEPGAYRLEAWMGQSRIPWIVTNPVYIDPAPGDAAAVRQPPPPGTAPIASVGEPLEWPLAMGPEWAIEHARSSSGTIVPAPDGLRFNYTVGTADGGDEFVALARSMGQGAESFDRIEFTASSSTPVRLSVQFRLPGTKETERWARSVYVDATPRTIMVRLADVQPVGFRTTSRPVVARVKSILFVMAWPNTAPGSTGSIELSHVRLLRAGDPGLRPNGQQQVQGAGQEQQVRRPGGQGGRQ
jgi:hypothetical protein